MDKKEDEVPHLYESLIHCSLWSHCSAPFFHSTFNLLKNGMGSPMGTADHLTLLRLSKGVKMADWWSIRVDERTDHKVQFEG